MACIHVHVKVTHQLTVCFAVRSPCVGRVLDSVVPGPYGQPTRLPDMNVGDVAVRIRQQTRSLHTKPLLRPVIVLSVLLAACTTTTCTPVVLGKLLRRSAMTGLPPVLNTSLD